MGTYFFTGFPGFIASALLRELLASEYRVDRVYALTLPEWVAVAQEKAARLAEEAGREPDLIHILPGDITKPDLMLSEPVRQSLAREISHVFHLAAVYDLAVPETIAWKVNVNGTRHVTDWVRTLPHLKRYVYYSTAYVSGTREGRIYEHELEMNQSFKNHYERTKFEAEVLVQKWKGELPLTVIRPGIVKGNSHTGETIKFDGLYFMLRFFDRLRFLPIIPYPSNRGAIGNFVPVDYVTKATVYLAHSDKGVGKTYHLTDPHAYTMNEVYAMLMEEYLGRKPKGTVPLSWMKAALSVPAVRKWLKVEKEALDYFDLVAVYDTTEAERDLADSSIRLPDFRETVKPLVEFYRLHREDPDKMIPVT